MRKKAVSSVSSASASVSVSVSSRSAAPRSAVSSRSAAPRSAVSSRSAAPRSARSGGSSASPGAHGHSGSSGSFGGPIAERDAAGTRAAGQLGFETELGALLILVELGGEWPSLANVRASTRRVVAQLEGEAPGAFAERVASSLDATFGRGIRLETVILACNERLDEAAESARRRALGMALGSMAKHRSGRVYLAASARSGGRLRHALSALARGLFDEWRTAGLEASVDFGEESRADAPNTPYAFTARVA